jgi:periplasmic glucans biosynthesis protein
MASRLAVSISTTAASEAEPMNARKRNQQPVQFQAARQCGARTKSGKPCRSPATTKGRCRLHGGASGSGGPPSEREWAIPSWRAPRVRMERD